MNNVGRFCGDCISTLPRKIFADSEGRKRCGFYCLKKSTDVSPLRPACDDYYKHIGLLVQLEEFPDDYHDALIVATEKTVAQMREWLLSEQGREVLNAVSGLKVKGRKNAQEDDFQDG